MTTLRVGIASYDEMKARTMAIARGDIVPSADEPTVWFTSVESFSRVLSDRNRDLLRTILEARPGSITELGALSGRAKSNLSRTLNTMARYGLVVFENGPHGTRVPRVPYDRITLILPLASTESFLEYNSIDSSEKGALMKKEKVTRVVDGDTFHTDKRKKPVRLANVDAPESNSASGSKAKDFLKNIIEGEEVSVDTKARDTYGRSVALVKKSGKSVNKMVKDKNKTNKK